MKHWIRTTMVVLLALVGVLGVALVVVGMVTMADCPSRSDCLAWRMLGVILWLPFSLMLLLSSLWLWRWPSWWALTPMVLALLWAAVFVIG